MGNLLIILAAIFLPPLAVFLTKGLGLHFIINILLLILTLGLGAIIHAFWCVLSERHPS